LSNLSLSLFGNLLTDWCMLRYFPKRDRLTLPQIWTFVLILAFHPEVFFILNSEKDLPGSWFHYDLRRLKLYQSGAQQNFQYLLYTT